MNNGKQSEQLLKVLGGHSASLDRTSKMQRATFYSDHKLVTKRWRFTLADGQQHKLHGKHYQNI